MIYEIHDEKHHYKYYFNTETGTYIRTGILDENGKDTGIDPFMGSFPHLIDIGIMGHCTHGRSGLCVKAGVECYQSGLHIYEDNMGIEDFTKIIKQCRLKTNQVALGGRGDPDQHEYFEEILKICQENQIIPNYTTSGLGMNDHLAAISKKYCGAVAVSWYRSDYTLKAIETLKKHDVTINIHYVLGSNTIDEAIERLENNTFPKGISALVFLLHKPKGQGSQKNVLSITDPRVIKLLKLIDNQDFDFDIGFDSCTVPGLININKNIFPQSIEPCEGARFSCYISPKLVMTPCSFDTEEKYGVSLVDKTIEEVWMSEAFENFRKNQRFRCPNCPHQENCKGGCPLMPEIILCNRNEKEIKVYEN